MNCISKDVHPSSSFSKVSQGASIRCLNDWISGFVAPLPELWNRLGLSGRGHFLTANSRGPRCCYYYCSLRSQRGPCSQQIHRDPLSPDFSGTWHASSWYIMIHQFMMRLWFQHIESASLWSEKQKTDVQISSRRALQFLLQVPVLWETAWHLPIAPAGTTSLTSQQENCQILICHDISISWVQWCPVQDIPKNMGQFFISHTFSYIFRICETSSCGLPHMVLWKDRFFFHNWP